MYRHVELTTEDKVHLWVDMVVMLDTVAMLDVVVMLDTVEVDTPATLEPVLVVVA
jgi:hypothetical protein